MAYVLPDKPTEPQTLAHKIISERRSELVGMYRHFHRVDKENKPTFDKFLRALRTLAKTGAIDAEALKAGSRIFASAIREQKASAVTFRERPEVTYLEKEQVANALGVDIDKVGAISVLADASNKTAADAFTLQNDLSGLLRKAGLRSTGHGDKPLAVKPPSPASPDPA